MQTEWKEAEKAVAGAYRALVARAQEEPASIGPLGAWRVVPLPDGFEARVVIARAPAPGEIRI